jgi:hypothetical protein
MADDNIIGAAMPVEGSPPPCDRCGSTTMGGLMTPELGMVCFNCLTNDEVEQLAAERSAANQARRD